MSVVRDTSELGRLDAVETAARIRAGELEPKEVIAAAIARARRLEPDLNAIFLETFDSARQAAESPAEGPFRGVPTFVKGLDDVAGQTNDMGSRALAANVARRTEPYVARMLATGLVSLGRSASPEIGLNVTTEPLAHGPTRNPWDTTRSTGGSSGGAAALVAAGVVPLAHASDAGGSIRIPASSCGLVGLKPSRQRGFCSLASRALPLQVFTYGAVTRSVRDSAHFVAAMEAASPAAKASRGEPALDPIGVVEGPQRERLHIGVYTDSPLGQPVDAEVRHATLAAAAFCRELGHTVEEIGCPYAGHILDDMWIYIGFLAWASIQGARIQKPGRVDVARFEPWTLGLAAHWRDSWRSSLRVLRRLRAVRETSTRLFSSSGGGYDLLLCPTLSAPPPEIGALAPDRPFDETLPLEKQHICFTPIQNITGEPAISLPMGQTADGLPVGVQLAAPPGGEARLLAIAYELEAAGGFASPD